jgi:hypothetical protein
VRSSVDKIPEVIGARAIHRLGRLFGEFALEGAGAGDFLRLRPGFPSRSGRALCDRIEEKMHTAYVDMVAAALRTERFGLVDIGCSGGIEPTWRQFGDRLAAIGFDASVEEVRRLQADEAHPGVRYVAALVDIRPDHPFAIRARGMRTDVDESVWPRLSAAWAAEIVADRQAFATHEQKIGHNRWRETELADAKISAPDYLQAENFTDIDFLKIDVDGPDFRVLQSFDGLFERFGILASRLEVTMVGDASDTLNTFHNTDRFMRRAGYVLFRLDNRTYSNRALPAPFESQFPGQTVSGRIFQAEAYYALDLGAAERAELAAKVSDEKLLKLSAVFSVWGQPDAAVELLQVYRARLASLIDVDRALDLLAAQAQPDTAAPLSYREYVSKFAADPHSFYPPGPEPPGPPPPPPPVPTPLARIKAAWGALNDHHYIEALRQREEERAAREGTEYDQASREVAPRTR